MIRNYLNPYLRNFAKNRLSLLIGIGGFALGIAVLTASLLFINNELTFDGFNQHKSSIYRIVFGDNDTNGLAYTSHIVGQTVQQDFPETKVISISNAGGARILFFNGDKKYTESAFYFISSEVFDVFSFPLINGDPQSCLKNPYTVVLTQKAANRYFGDENPVGKALKVDWGGTIHDLNVTGLMADLPLNSHLRFDFLISFPTAELLFQPKSLFTDWTANFQYNYVYVPDHLNIESIEKSLRTKYAELVPSQQRSFDLRLQPLDRIHLHSRLAAEHSKNNDVMYVYIAASLGFLIILISFVNYLNILFALYSKRIKELGVRKVLGAGSLDFGLQFVLESGLNLLMAFALALTILYFTSSFFSGLLNSDVSFDVLLNNLAIPIGSLIGVSIVLAVYILFFFSRLKPVSLIGSKQPFLTGHASKSVMVGLQVAISLILIIGSIAVKQQIQFLEDRELGFDKDNIIVVPLGEGIRPKIASARHELVNQTEVISMALSSQIPSSNLNFKVPCFPEGGNPMGNSDPWNVAMVVTDQDFVKTYNLTLSAGRAFSDEIRSDSSESFIVNETFVKELNWKDPIGRRIDMNFNPGTGTIERKSGTIVGIVRDFHFESLHKPIVPIVFIYKPTAFFVASFRLTPGFTQSKLESLKARWSTLFPDAPFDYFYITQRLESSYKTERSFAKSTMIFSATAILISCLGIYGLMSFIVQSRQKEITIRKVLGASEKSIMSLLLIQILKIVFIAFVATIPFCMYGVNAWLNGFAYRSALGPEVFLTALLGFIVIVLIVISGNLLKSARISVVENLRRE